MSVGAVFGGSVLAEFAVELEFDAAELFDCGPGA
jgi:hypothetical protein